MKEMNEESKEENVGLQLNDAFSFLTCEEEGEGNCTSGEEDVITNLQSSHSASTNQSAGGQLDSADQLADSNHAAEELLDTQGYQDQSHENGDKVVMRRQNSVTTNGADDDDDIGVYAESVRTSVWRFVKEDDWESFDETLPHGGNEDSKESLERSDSVSTTISEKEFVYHRPYAEISTRQVQRKSSLQTFARANSWEITAEKVVNFSSKENSQGLGFHIIGSHPTKVSTIVQGSAAEKAGIKVDDVILAINYESVLQFSHDKIVQLLVNAKNSDVTIEFCRESSFSGTTGDETDRAGTVYSAYAYRLANSTFNLWKKRWLVLKSDNCLYYYKSEHDKEILGAIPLSGYTLQRVVDNKRLKDHAFKLVHHTKTYIFAAMDNNELSRWASLLNKATAEESSMDNWIDASAHNVRLPALSISNVDCSGYLHKMGGHYKSWKKRYCVLKDGCLFYYCDVNSRSAQGVAHLHGYTTNANPVTNKKNAFDLVPPESKMRTFHFYAETKVDQERWLRAMKLSIGRWVLVT
ncbi:hypothetical protein EB796_022742 [Bugula neritina]|uniref:Uncharacterized protein n=1 Tax=Bugula neritina TaxID=10212 RepID=A0A7J7IZS0_BUGNE|nr:hypothetical protein EB796_022742 [Bugula neritina]